jgi:hypothetical protein
LQKKYNKLYVFGDSYSTPGICVSPQNSFWGLAATHLSILQVMNYSMPKNSFDSIMQLLTGVQKGISWQDDLIFIGIPPLERITVFDDYKNTSYTGQIFDTKTWQNEKINVECHRGLVSLQNYGNDKELIIHSDRSWLETQVMRSIFFITTWLDNIKANYLILNLSKDFDKNNVWGPSSFVLPYCINHSSCIIFENTYYGVNLNINKPADFDRFGWHGHHGPDGNRYFFEKSLLPKLIECGLA